jgi:hypothetical protein
MDTNGTQYSFDAFLPDYIAQLNALMVPTGYVVRVVPVPEPALALIAAALGTCVWTGWRRLRRDARRARAA